MNAQTALAAVFHGAGQELTLESFPVPVLRGGEVMVRIRCTTICGSDLHTYFGRRVGPTPSVLGHEMVGEVAAMGPDGASDFRGAKLMLGDRITWSAVWSCGRCFYCARGLRPKCEQLMKFGHEKITTGQALCGGLAEYCWLPEGTSIFRIPAGLTDSVVTPANCATATVAAVLRHAPAVKEEVVVIHGAGMLGLTACAMASAAGAAAVIAVDPIAERRERALSFGASLALDSDLRAEVLAERIKAESDGRGAAVGMDFSGRPEAVEVGLGLLRMGGQFIIAGAVLPSRPMQLPAEQIVRRMLKITGVHNYQPEDLERALKFLSSSAKRYPFDELVAAQTFSLREVNAAFAYAEAEKPWRVAVIPL